MQITHSVKTSLCDFIQFGPGKEKINHEKKTKKIYT